MMCMTIIKIDKPTKVSEIKKAFNNQFPYLKLEFFKSKHKKEEGSDKKSLIVNDFEIKPILNNETIVFSDEMLVHELESQFAEKLKLSVQIFRKSGRTWLETTFTDSWSLKKQNQEGIELSNI
jgi:hypothetical protein